MSDNMASDLEQAGLEANQDQSGQGDSSTSLADADAMVKSLLGNEGFMEAVAKYAESKAESKVDKKTARLWNLMSKPEDFIQKVAKYAAEIQNPEEAIRKAVNDDLVEERLSVMRGSTDEPSVSPGREAQGAAQSEASSLDFVAAFKAAGFVDEEGKLDILPEDMSFVTGFDGSQAELQNSLLVRKASQPKPLKSGAGTIVQPGGGLGSGSHSMTVEEAGTELVQIQGKPRSQRTPRETERVAEIMKVLEEADQKK